jgi:hypothetical protein
MKYATAFLAALSLVAVPALAQAPVTTLTIPMHALNGSGENGRAVLVQGTDGVHIHLALENGSSVSQPTHIHIGTCGAIVKAPEYGLSDTVNGQNDSIVRGVTITQLLAGHYAINVHKSGYDLATYSSCGDIR